MGSKLSMMSGGSKLTPEIVKQFDGDLDAAMQEYKRDFGGFRGGMFEAKKTMNEN